MIDCKSSQVATNRASMWVEHVFPPRVFFGSPRPTISITTTHDQQRQEARITCLVYLMCIVSMAMLLRGYVGNWGFWNPAQFA